NLASPLLARRAIAARATIGVHAAVALRQAYVRSKVARRCAALARHVRRAVGVLFACVVRTVPKASGRDHAVAPPICSGDALGIRAARSHGVDSRVVDATDVAERVGALLWTGRAAWPMAERNARGGVCVARIARIAGIARIQRGRAGVISS